MKPILINLRIVQMTIRTRNCQYNDADSDKVVCKNFTIWKYNAQKYVRLCASKFGTTESARAF